jgi:EpsI family protein
MHNTKNIIVGFAMVAAAVLAVVLRPASDNTVGQSVAQASKAVDLEQVFPAKFGEWQIDQSLSVIEPPPDVKSSLSKIYSQTLSRTYVNANRQRIMLSVAYGNGFDKQLDVHRPEYCYRAQGFEVGPYEDQVFRSQLGNIPVRRLIATQGARVEPITYWITISGKTVSSTLMRKIHKIRRLLTGQVDSGMLIRVSSIDNDTKLAYATQQAFINAMVSSLTAKNRNYVISLDEVQ